MKHHTCFLRYFRSYILIEILISLAFVTMCAVPLLLPHFVILRAEIKTLEELQLERLADVAFAEVKQMLFENKISWEEIGKAKEKHKLVQDLSPVSIKIGKGSTAIYARSFDLYCEKKSQARSDPEFRLIKITIHFKPANKEESVDYTYLQFLERTSKGVS